MACSLSGRAKDLPAPCTTTTTTIIIIIIIIIIINITLLKVDRN